MSNGIVCRHDSGGSSFVTTRIIRYTDAAIRQIHAGESAFGAEPGNRTLMNRALDPNRPRSRDHLSSRQAPGLVRRVRRPLGTYGVVAASSWACSSCARSASSLAHSSLAFLVGGETGLPDLCRSPECYRGAPARFPRTYAPRRSSNSLSYVRSAPRYCPATVGVPISKFSFGSARFTGIHIREQSAVIIDGRVEALP